MRARLVRLRCKFCFDNASLQKSCLFVDLVCFFLLGLRVDVFLNATRSDRSVRCLPLKGKSGSMQFVETKERSSQSPWELLIKYVRYISG